MTKKVKKHRLMLTKLILHYNIIVKQIDINKMYRGINRGRDKNFVAVRNSGIWIS